MFAPQCWNIPDQSGTWNTYEGDYYLMWEKAVKELTGFEKRRKGLIEPIRKMRV
jgi:hypothetical protein